MQYNLFISIRTIKTLWVLLITGFIFSPVANANLQEKFSTPLKEIELLPVEQFKAQTKFYNKTPFNNKYLEFEFRYPTGFTERDNSGLGGGGENLSTKVLSELAKFIGPARLMSERSRIIIEAGLMEYQLTVDQWFYEYVLRSGYTIQGLNVNSKNELEALLIFVDGDVTYVMRLKAIINGKRILLIKYLVPINDYESEKTLQAQVVKSFRVLNKDTSIVEDLGKTKFLDIAEVSYPQSWVNRRSVLEDLGLMYVELLNVKNPEEVNVRNIKNHDGKIDVMLISSNSQEYSLQSEMQKIKDQFIKEGAKVSESFQLPEELKMIESFPYYESKGYKIVGDKARISETEYWITIGYYGYYYYIVTLTTPSRNSDFLLWARNTQSYKIVLENFIPLAKGLANTN